MTYQIGKILLIYQHIAIEKTPSSTPRHSHIYVYVYVYIHVFKYTLYICTVFTYAPKEAKQYEYWSQL